MRYLLFTLCFLFFASANDLSAQFNHADKEFKMIKKYDRIIKESNKYILFYLDLMAKVEQEGNMTKSDMMDMQSARYKWEELSAGQWMQVGMAEYDIKKYGEEWIGAEAYTKLETIRAKIDANIELINTLTKEWWKSGLSQESLAGTKVELMQAIDNQNELLSQLKTGINATIESDVKVAMAHHDLINELENLIYAKGDQAASILKIKEMMTTFDFEPYAEFEIVKSFSESAFEKINGIITAVESGEYSAHVLIRDYVNADDEFVDQEEDGVIELINWALEVWKNNNPDAKYVPLSHLRYR